MNQVTSYVDASFIYGSDVCKLAQLRAQNGLGSKLNVTRHPGNRHAKSLMPQENTHPECRSNSRMCFSAGQWLGGGWYLITKRRLKFIIKTNQL